MTWADPLFLQGTPRLNLHNPKTGNGVPYPTGLPGGPQMRVLITGSDKPQQGLMLLLFLHW